MKKPARGSNHDMWGGRGYGNLLNRGRQQSANTRSATQAVILSISHSVQCISDRKASLSVSLSVLRMRVQEWRFVVSVRKYAFANNTLCASVERKT